MPQKVVIQHVRTAQQPIVARVSAGQSNAGTSGILRVSGAALSSLRFVTTGLDYAQADSDPNTVLGMTIAASAANTQARILPSGLWKSATWNWIPGQPIHLGNAGFPTQSGGTVVVGVAVSPTEMFVRAARSVVAGVDPGGNENYRGEIHPADLVGPYAVVQHNRDREVVDVSIFDDEGELSLPWVPFGPDRVKVDFSGLAPISKIYIILVEV